MGAGATGGYYGARLQQAGAQVRFLVRERRRGRLREHGLVARSALGDMRLPVETLVRDELIGVAAQADIVLLTCKAFELDEAMDTIAPAVAAGALVLPVINGMEAYNRLDQRFGREKVLGGIAYIATMLMPDGAIQHFGPNDVFVVGARAASQEAAAQRFHELIARTPGMRRLSADIEQELWEKWVMLASGATAITLMRANVSEILRAAGGEAVMRQSIEEVTRVATLSGHPPGPASVGMIERVLLDPASPWAASMARDMTAGTTRLESQAILGDLVAQAKLVGTAVPLLQTAYCNLQVYEAQREAASAR
ncbi:MAG TPA: 2-dehydropantoate 2-reductase [Ramlibacter sp.]|nr:2-dehydropantoate 2-reductase [Ramlibacter sp.]